MIANILHRYNGFISSIRFSIHDNCVAIGEKNRKRRKESCRTASGEGEGHVEAGETLSYAGSKATRFTLFETPQHKNYVQLLRVALAMLVISGARTYDSRFHD